MRALRTVIPPLVEARWGHVPESDKVATVVGMDSTMVLQMTARAGKAPTVWEQKKLEIGTVWQVQHAKVRVAPGYPLAQVRLQVTEETLLNMVETEEEETD